MERPRDYASTLRWRLGNGRVRASNAWYRIAGRPVQGRRQRVGNWRNGRAIARGRRDVVARAGDQVRSRMPVVRNRVNPATGRPHRDDAWMGRLSDRSLARMKAGRAQDNRRFVRQMLEERQPAYARAVDCAVRESIPHRQRPGRQDRDRSSGRRDSR